MNRSFIPYHLRQNKAIDRNLFIELLHRINGFFTINDYEYISMGGPFLEDFKSIHSGTGIGRMISFEIDKNTFQRQEFNRPLSCIKLENKKSSQFVADYEFPSPTVIWLDFTTPSFLASDLNDVFELMGKLRRGDIMKVTLNAHAASLPVPDGTTELEKPRKRYEFLKDLIADYLPIGTKPEQIVSTKYPGVLFETLKLVFDKGMHANKRDYFQPLTSFLYADGQQMMTFTGIILDRNESEKFLVNTKIKDWEMFVGKHQGPISINVPDLSVKERMFIDSLLPEKTAAEVQSELKFYVAPTADASLKGIENYVLYYKQFPYFSKVVL